MRENDLGRHLKDRHSQNPMYANTVFSRNLKFGGNFKAEAIIWTEIRQVIGKMCD